MIGMEGLVERPGSQMEGQIDGQPAAADRSQARQQPVGDELAGQRLDRALSTLLPQVPRTRIFRLIRKGEVRVNGKRASPEQRLLAGDVLRIPPLRAESASDAAAARGEPPRAPASLQEMVTRAILYEDERLLVINKPAGIAVHGGSGLSFGVIEALRGARPHEELELAHRLDRDTSGCLLVARKSSSLRTLHTLLREGAVVKKYLVLVIGLWQLGHKRVDVPLNTETRVHGERTVRAQADGKRSVTEFRLVEQYAAGVSMLEATLHTGRTHQIRVHAAYCGHPVAGDDKYGDAAANQRLRDLGLQRLFLHAHQCSFTWPGGADMDFTVPLPDELRSVLNALTATRGLRVSGNPARAGSRRGGSAAARRGRSGRR